MRFGSPLIKKPISAISAWNAGNRRMYLLAIMLTSMVVSGFGQPANSLPQTESVAPAKMLPILSAPAPYIIRPGARLTNGSHLDPHSEEFTHVQCAVTTEMVKNWKPWAEIPKNAFFGIEKECRDKIVASIAIPTWAAACESQDIFLHFRYLCFSVP